MLTFPLGSKKGMGGFKKVVGRFKQHVGKINTWFPFSRGVLRKALLSSPLCRLHAGDEHNDGLCHTLATADEGLDVTCTTLELPKGHTWSRCMSHYVTI